MPRAQNSPAMLHISIEVTSAEKRAIARRARGARVRVAEYVKHRALKDAEEQWLNLLAKELSASATRASASIDSALAACAAQEETRKVRERRARAETFASLDENQVTALRAFFQN